MARLQGWIVIGFVRQPRFAGPAPGGREGS
jgi:hypothetical protein